MRYPSQKVPQQKRDQTIQAQLRYTAAARLRQAHRLKLGQGKEAVLPEAIVRHAVRNFARVKARGTGLADDAPPDSRNRTASQRLHDILGTAHRGNRKGRGRGPPSGTRVTRRISAARLARCRAAIWSAFVATKATRPIDRGGNSNRANAANHSVQDDPSATRRKRRQAPVACRRMRPVPGSGPKAGRPEPQAHRDHQTWATSGRAERHPHTHRSGSP